MNHFPSEINAWKNDVARRLVALRDGIDTIMMTMPMLPDPEIGMPFTGPLSPVPFGWIPEPGTGGTVNTGGTPNTGGTSTAGGCPGANIMHVEYVLTGPGSCAGTYKLNLPFVSHIGAVCRWADAGSSVMTYNTSTGVTIFFDTQVSYQSTVVPPNSGSAISLSLTTNLTPCVASGTATVTGV